MEVIWQILMLILLFLILFIPSNFLGKKLIKSDNKLYIFRSIIGFCFLLAILQVGYYVIQYFSMSSSVHLIWTGLVFLVLLIFGIKHLKKEDFFFLKTYEFYLLLILVFGIIKVLPYSEAGDDIFYMPLFMENAYTDMINHINPRNGYNLEIGGMYIYQGYYLLQSFLYYITHTLLNSVTDILLSFKSTMSLVAITFASIILKFCRLEFKKLSGNIYYLISLLAVLLIGVLEWSHVYWGSFMLFPIFVPLYILVFKNYVEEKDKKAINILFIMNVAMISLASASMFIIGFINFGFIMYQLLKKKLKIEEYYFSLLPVILYASLFLDMLWIYPIMLIGYYFINKHKLKVNLFLNKYLIYLFYALPFIFALLSYLLLGGFSWQLYKVGYPILIFNVVFTLFFLYVILIKKKEVNSLIYLFIIITIYFFNPLVSGFISKYFTSEVVYFRIFFITKNFLMITYIFSYLIDYFKKYKILKIGIIVGVCGLICYYGYILMSKTFMEPTYYVKYNYLLRETDNSLDLGNEISLLPDNSRVMSIYFAPRIYNINSKSVVYRYPDNPLYRVDTIHKILYNKNDYTNADMKAFKEALKTYKFDYIIIFNDETIKSRLNEYKKVYENNTFVLYEV